MDYLFTTGEEVRKQHYAFNNYIFAAYVCGGKV